jgi:predicted O-linked N-acetylglucosamine transferase (SPINDLY family)
VIDDTFGWENRMKTLSIGPCFTHYWPNEVPDASELKQPYYDVMKGHLSFGTLNKTAKINQQMVDMWDALLDAFPGSRLCLRQNYVFKFRNQDRVVFLEHCEKHADHLRRYNQIDVALDTSPYSGTTTTCESMLMGVPVVTLTDRKGRRIHQNVSASLLINSGMPHLEVGTFDEYVAVCRRLEAEIRADPANFKRNVQKNFVTGRVMVDASVYMAAYESAVEGALLKNRRGETRTSPA